MSDVRDILDLERSQTPELVKDSFWGSDPKKQKKKKWMEATLKRPEGMHRELYALLYSDKKDAPPILPTGSGQGYKQMKAKLGMKRVRPWRWMPFTNPARKDGAILHHWRRIADEGKDYPFARFNKTVQVLAYTDAEYQQHLQVESWSRVETDYMMDMCRRFDLRFLVIRDRWDTAHPKRSIEDIKERYYGICNTLTKVRAPAGQEPKLRAYDAAHERKRKEQLCKLFDRTPEQIEEEQMLMNELRKIEMRKKEREKKTQDLQKLITAADNNTETRRQERRNSKKKVQQQKVPKLENPSIETAGIKFPDVKATGVSLRNQRMKLPTSVGQKKTKAIEQLLQELAIDLNPIPTEEISNHFNELRSDMVLLYELKLALANCEFELQTLRHQFEAVAPGKSFDMLSSTSGGNSSLPSVPGGPHGSPEGSGSGGGKLKGISELLDVRKRRAAIEQSNILKKMKQKL